MATYTAHRQRVVHRGHSDEGGGTHEEVVVRCPTEEAQDAVHPVSVRREVSQHQVRHVDGK
jgi:hypothetical protein